MKVLTVLLGIVMFAVITAILYAWGLRNDITQEANLERLLLSKASRIVVKYLKKNGTATKKDICEQIKKVKGGFFWSKKKVAVNDPETFSKVLIEHMISQQLIQSVDKKGYQLLNK